MKFHNCLGRGVTLRLIRNTEKCDGLEEVKPVDQNVQYDFNFQQFTVLPNEVTVYPVCLALVLDYYVNFIIQC